MTDLMSALPLADRRLVAAMAAEADTTPEALGVEIVRAWLALARTVPEVLPADPLAGLARTARGGLA